MQHLIAEIHPEILLLGSINLPLGLVGVPPRLNESRNTLTLDRQQPCEARLSYIAAHRMHLNILKFELFRAVLNANQVARQ